MNLAEQMAMAVIKGDRVAAYALADLLLEERANPSTMEQEAARIHNENRPAVDGYEVYRWPEFRAFAARLGFVWDLYTTDVTIRLAEGEAVIISHNYQGRAGPGGAVDTTNMHNETLRTYAPPARPVE